jgi:hypothetical protein
MVILLHLFLKKGQEIKLKNRMENPFYLNKPERGFFLSIWKSVKIPLTMNNNLLLLK